jgi:hypothetical protein
MLPHFFHISCVSSWDAASSLLVGNCPHLVGGLSCKALLLHRGSFSPCHKDAINHSCPSLVPRWLWDRLSQSKGQQVENRDRCQAFLLFLVNLWPQVRSQCFSGKTVQALLKFPSLNIPHSWGMKVLANLALQVSWPLLN